VLIKSTPEGARDFLVPSRLHHGNFYALPQSPQILKQLLMVGGMDRYYQIVKCFRDEDFRGDRQPEFTQIDCEMAFVTQDDILRTFEGLMKHIFKSVLNVELPDFLRLPYEEALSKYGTDKPDLRFGCEIIELNEVAKGTSFAVFENVINSGGIVAGLNAKGCAAYTRKQIDQLTEFVKAPHRGAGGLVWIKWGEDGLKSSLDGLIEKGTLPHGFTQRIAQKMGAQQGDLLLIMADLRRKTQKVLGDLRLELGNREGWRKDGDWSIFWVVDFPLFEKDEETGERTFAHHPFVMPHPDQLHHLDTEPDKVHAYCYDMVMNGNEILSGSVRIHRPDIQAKIFDLLGMSEEEQQQKFGFLLEAFKYGAPPHAGCAFGLDRIVMLMAGGDTIRDVIAFPKTAGGRDAMMDAPATVPPKALDELGIALKG
jgi:aspartyl-tRNA synthetase